MRYLMSDPHNDLVNFRKLMKKIGFNKKEDTLYILGDVLDRGSNSSDGFALLNYIRPYIDNGSIVLLLGNHEYFAKKYITNELDKRMYSAFGGSQTIKAIDAMNEESKLQFIKFIESLPLYVEIESPYYDKRLLLSHTGCVDPAHYVTNPDGSINTILSIEKYIKEESLYSFLITGLPQLPAQGRNLLDHYVVLGHIPTITLYECGNQIYKGENYMNLDTGCAYRKLGGCLSCYCVDNDTAYYQ